MDNRTDTAILLQQAAGFPPTHLILVNVDPSLHDPLEQMAAFLPSEGVTIVHAYEGEEATVPIREINEAQLIRMLPDLASFDLDDPYVWATAAYRFHRPELIQAIRASAKQWSDDRGNDRTCLLVVGAPRTPLDAVLLGELPLDAAQFFLRRVGGLPLVLRFVVAPRRPFESEADLPLAHVLADAEQTYFALPECAPGGSAEDAGSACSNPFDMTVWVDAADGAEVVQFLRDVLRMHGEENAALVAASGGPRPSVVPSLEAALAADAERRQLDWLALCATAHAPRLWTFGLPALMAALDVRGDKRRAREPLAGVAKYAREEGWDANLLVQTYLSQIEYPRAPQEDFAQADFPYRVTDEDRASKLELSRHLSDAGDFERAARLAEELLEDDPNHRVLNRMLGTDLYVAGHRDRGGQVLRHCIELTEIDPLLDEAQRADEIATLHHLLHDYDAAISGYERALEADPRNVHAYQGLVFIHRARGEESLADFWANAASRRNLHLPLVAGDDRLEEAFERPADFGAGEGDRERRSRWWSFLKG